MTGENYTAVLMGDVSGNWMNTGARSVDGRQEAVSSKQLAVGGWPERGIVVGLPDLGTSVGKEIVVPVSVQGIANKNVISYEFDLRYDPSVIQPLSVPVDLKGTISRGLTFVANAEEAGLLRVVVYGAMPIDSDGVLLNLRFAAVGKPGSVSPLTFQRIMFNEGDPGTTATDGHVELSAPKTNIKARRRA